MARDRDGGSRRAEHEIRFGATGNGTRVLEIAPGGEFREQFRTAIRQYAVPVLQQAIREADGSRRLLWEELDISGRTVRQHDVPLGSTLGFRLSGSEDAIELDVQSQTDVRPVLSIDPRPVPRVDGRAHLGWRTARPLLRWQYRGHGRERRIEVQWRIPGFPVEWVEMLRKEGLGGPVACSIDGEAPLELELERSDAFAFAGRLPYSGGEPVLTRTIALDLPLAWVSPEGGEAAGRLEVREHAWVEVLDFHARVGGRPTRYVAENELDERFAVTVVTPEDAVLPRTIPAGVWPGVPWDLATRRGGVYVHGESSRCDWSLVPATGESASWRDVEWDREAGRSLRFVLGDNPRSIAQIRDRGARISWSIHRPNPGKDPEEEAEGEEKRRAGLLCMIRPDLTPARRSGDELVLDLARAPYSPTVEAVSDGITEYFTVDGASELPEERLVPGPDSWSVWDEAGEEAPSATVFGEVAGYVRWCRPSAQSGGGPSTAAEWAAGSGAVLVAQEGPAPLDRWGGLYVPAPRGPRGATPLNDDLWRIIPEVAPLRSGDGGGILVPIAADAPSIWISLWGYFARFDRQTLTLQEWRDESTATAWVTRPGLPLFPSPGNRVLRALSPLYAVHGDRWGVALEEGRPRPTLRLGSEVVSRGVATVVPGGETLVRGRTAEEDEVPDRFPDVLRVETEAPLGGVAGRALWLAVQPLPSADGRDQPGYLVSWSARYGWCFRGYFAGADAPVRLGCVRYEEPRPAEGHEPFVPVLLGEGRRGFTLNLADADLWSADTPPEIRSGVGLRDIGAWKRAGFAPSRLPAPLGSYNPIHHQDGQAIEFVRHLDVIAQRLPIRVWQPISAEALRAWDASGAVEELGVDTQPPAAAAARGEPLPPPAPERPAPAVARPAAPDPRPAEPPVLRSQAPPAPPALPDGGEPEVLGADDPPPPEEF